MESLSVMGWGVGLGNYSAVVAAVASPPIPPQNGYFWGKRFLHDWASEQRSWRATAWKRLVRASRIFFVFIGKVRNLRNYLFSREILILEEYSLIS